MQPCLAIFQNLGPMELIVIGIIALLIFGRRLPEVGRSLGKSFVEFKKGLKDTGDEIKEIRSEAHRAMSSDNDDKPTEKATDFNDPKKDESKTESIHS